MNIVTEYINPDNIKDKRFLSINTLINNYKSINKIIFIFNVLIILIILYLVLQFLKLFL